jgi:predicted transglutaminase-like cysteine proteinase
MKTFALALLALAASSAPAAAQVAPAYAYFNKSDAILEGAPSALAAIMARQSGAAPAALAATPASFTVVPASQGALFNRAIFPAYTPAIVDAPVPTDRPDVFNTIALPITHTSFDRRWAQIAHAPIGARAAAFASSIAGRNPLDRLDAVNRFVNSHVVFESDAQQYGVSDRWMPAAETLRRGHGDCEDFAIAKLQLLRSAGFADKDLYLVILHDVARRADHAVLVARAEDRLLVLDNGTSRIVDSAMITDYRPIFTLSGNKVWTHGYRHVDPPVVLASNDRPQQSAMVEMASVNSPIAPAGMAN